MNKPLPISAFCLALLSHTMAQAQGWVGTYSPDRMMSINGMQERADGSFLVTGFNLGQAEDGLRTMVISANGTVLGATDHDSLYSVTYAASTSDGGFAILGSAKAGTGTVWAGHSLLRVDADGQKLWHQHIDTLPAGSVGNLAIDLAPDGGFFSILNLEDDTSNQPYVRLARTDADGNTLWQRNYFEEDSTTYAFEVHCTADGGALVHVVTAGTAHARFIKVDAAGEEVWTYSADADDGFLQAFIAMDGNILLFGPLSAGGSVVRKLDQNGVELWSSTYPAFDGNLRLTFLLEVAPNEFAGLGVRYEGGTAMSLVRLDDAGNILLQQPLPLANLGLGLTNSLFLNQKGFIRTSDGGFLCGGRIHYDPGTSPLPGSGFLIKMDAQGHVYPGLLGGTAFADPDANCEQDSTGTVLNGTILSFSNGADEFHGVVAADNYMVGLGHGHYAVEATPISPYWAWGACNPASVALPASGDTIVSFGFQPLVSAPYIVMDGYARERLCMSNTYTLRYCNNGTASFTGVLAVKMGANATVDSASVAWVNNSNGSVTFAVSDLGVGQCRTVKVYFSRPCDMDLMGRTFCIQADAYANDMYLPGPTWDSSNLTVVVGTNPAADSVYISVLNTGEAMLAAQDLLIHEDSTLYATIPVQLAAATLITHYVPANGSTWRGTITQTPGNPNSAFATAALEGAGTHPDGSISLGFVDDYPLYGQYAFHHTACNPMLNSYDPNRKTVVPEGMGADRFVDSTATLEYTLEFQNTGTAEAYVVRLVDTLTTHLDPATFLPGASSHPYTWRFLAANVVEFLFEGIHLPDSTTNEAESHGFVRFRIEQRRGNPMGTVINNNVGIYFDFNPPVITNTAMVTVGFPLITAIISPVDTRIALRAYPNPFTESAVIEVKGAYGPLTLTVTDVSGRIVKRQTALHTDRFILDRDALPCGQYVFEVHVNGRSIGHGKIMVN